MPRVELASPFTLDIPLDASGIEGFTPDAPVKVALVGAKGVVAAKTVDLDKEGHGEASFEFEQHPGGLRVVVGPADADDDELVNLQTIARDLPLRAIIGPKVRLAPIAISAYYWHWWRRWCRTFTIRGRVLCADGSPVPGAKVCASDVDVWWWWSSRQQVGCATTDASGAFSISFRWCCGWWPWWWWRTHFWQLEPSLVERISPVIARAPHLKLPSPSPRPSLHIFDQLTAPNTLPTAPASPEVDLAALPALRDKLLAQLPASPEFEQIGIWPWAPWNPWWDCTPDIIFKVTQDCQGQERVIVDEGFANARWNIDPVTDVTLTASQEACCLHGDPTPEGNCMVISTVCYNDLINTIGGNPGAPPAPVGFLNPGAAAVFGDRPYAGTVRIEGLFGSGANVDYYEFVWATIPGGPYGVMPPAAAGGFARTFWGPPLGSAPGTPPSFNNVSFAFAPMGGRLVVESREHYEATHEPATWGTTRFWVYNRDVLINWQTANTFADDTYYLQLVGYSETGGELGEAQVLPLCDTETPNGLALTIDNSTSDLEPACDIVDVRINGVFAGPCSNVNAKEGGVLTVDFVAYDEDAHLAYYSLIATYGKNHAVNLLGVPHSLTPVALGAIPAADFVGPDYGAALGQGAASPKWSGGGLRLTIPDLRNAFPETCCYQLELRVYKRTVVNCDHDFTPAKLSFYSLTVVV